MIAIYARVSTGQQVSEGTSLDIQVELCTQKAITLAADNPLIKIYREEGFSGEDISRPALDELRSDIESSSITHLVCTHPDRLSRDLTDKLVICKEFERYGVKLVFVDGEYQNTPEGQLFFNIASVIAQYELAQIQKRTTRGRIKAVKDHQKIMPMRSAPYGYDLVKGSLKINQSEAYFVGRIYTWYVYERISMRAIGERLYKMGATPKRGESSNWNASSIRRVLTSEIYIGKYYYNRRKVKKKPGEKTDTGKARKSYTYRDPSEWIVVDVPAIVDKEIYDLAQQVKKKNKKILGRNVKREYLLKSMIRCGHCGRLWQAATYSGRQKTTRPALYPCYKCPGKLPAKYGDGVQKCQAPRTVRADLLDRYVWNIITDILLNPETFTDDLKSGTPDTSVIEKAIETMARQVDHKEKEKTKIKTLYLKDLINEEEMTSELRKLNKEQLEVRKEINKYRRRLENMKDAQSPYKLLLTAAAVCTAVENDKRGDPLIPFSDKRMIAEMLINEIEFKFYGHLVSLTYTGAINQMLKDKHTKKMSTQDIGLSLQCQKI